MLGQFKTKTESNRTPFLFCLVWICYQSRLSEAVRGNFAKQRYKRTQFAFRWVQVGKNGASGTSPPTKARPLFMQGAGRCKHLRFKSGEEMYAFVRTKPKERNPKLLPIGDGFGFLIIFEENVFSGICHDVLYL